MQLRHHGCQLITITPPTTTTVDPAAATSPPPHLYHYPHTVKTHHHLHAHAAAKRLPTDYFGRNAGPNDADVVWALG